MFVFLLLCFLNLSEARRLDLRGNDWIYRSNENNYTGKALVPGDIYSDLYRNGQIENPLYGNGDQKLLWVGRSSWVYEKIFNISDEAYNVMDLKNYYPSICHATPRSTISISRQGGGLSPPPTSY
jgi:hypothetical protein